MSKAAKSGDAPARKRGKLPIVIGLVVVLAGAGGGYFWWAKQQAVKAAESADKSGHDGTASAGDGEHEEKSGHGVLLPLDTFTVNLADKDATRFLRTNEQLELEVEEDVLKELEHEKVPIVRARAAVLELLAEQTSDVINTPAGKEVLKKDIQARAGKALHHKVSDVLFSDFVIQF